MSTYRMHLPRVFPYCVVLPEEEVQRAVILLLVRADLLSGSSFAVTSDTGGVGGEDDRTLWLSRASAEHLACSGLASDVIRDAVRADIDRQRIYTD